MLGYQSSFNNIPWELTSDDEQLDKPVNFSIATIKSVSKNGGIIITIVLDTDDKDRKNKRSKKRRKKEKYRYSYPDKLGRICNRQYRQIMYDDEQEVFSESFREEMRKRRNARELDYINRLKRHLSPNDFKFAKDLLLAKHKNIPIGKFLIKQKINENILEMRCNDIQEVIKKLTTLHILPMQQ